MPEPSFAGLPDSDTPPALLWTFLAPEQLFADDAPACEYAVVDGVPLEGVREGAELRVTRVVSTDPFDYLKISPGQRLPAPERPSAR